MQRYFFKVATREFLDIPDISGEKRLEYETIFKKFLNNKKRAQEAAAEKALPILQKRYQ